MDVALQIQNTQKNNSMVLFISYFWLLVTEKNEYEGVPQKQGQHLQTHKEICGQTRA